MAAKKKTTRVSKARTPPFPPYPAWSSAKFWGFLRSGLRACYNRYPVKWEVLKQARRAYVGSDKRTKWEYQCAKCKGWFKGTEVSVDHIEPAGSLNCYEDIPGFVERLFVGPQGLQVLDDKCHNEKTAKERKKE